MRGNMRESEKIEAAVDEAEHNSGGTVPYAGQITSLESWDGSGATAVEVAVEQLTYGD